MPIPSAMNPLPLVSPAERQIILGNLLTAPVTGGLATGVGGALGGLLLAGLHRSANPQISKAVQSLFGPSPLHAGLYGSILGYLTAKAATKTDERRRR